MERQDHSVHRWSEVTPQIAFSPNGKVPNRNKINSFIKLNKFHSKPVCFGSRKTREEQKICLKVCLFGFPEVLVMESATTAARQVVSSSTLIGPFEFVHECEGPLNLNAQILNGPIRVEDETTLRTAVVVDPITSTSGKPKRQILRQIFRSSQLFQPPKHTYLEWNLLGSLELLFLLWLGTFPVDEKGICGVTPDQRCTEWSAFPFF